MAETLSKRTCHTNHLSMKKIILLLMAMAVFQAGWAQDGAISFGYAKTSLEQNAINFAISYLKKSEPMLEMFKDGKRSLLSFSPDIDILLGSDDSFNGLTVKYVGNIMRFQTTTVAGIEGVPDLGRLFHNFPVALGFETAQDFSFINGIVEAGYIPWYQNDRRVPALLRQTKAGVFLQGGFRASLADNQINENDTRKPSESQGKEILRTKMLVGFSPTHYFGSDKSFGISMVGNGTAWFDFLNQELYYRLEGRLRLIFLTNYYLDFGYEKGSGAPNFMTGEQFTTNLSIIF
jgi:hypothetical protein